MKTQPYNQFRQATFVGNVGSDFKTSGEGKKSFVAFSFASHDQYQDGEELKSKTHWFRMVCYAKVAEELAQQIKKGDFLELVCVPTTHEWTDKDGKAYSSVQFIVISYWQRNKKAIETEESAPPISEDVMAREMKAIQECLAKANSSNGAQI